MLRNKTGVCAAFPVMVVLLAAFCLSNAGAQTGNVEHDPFFPSVAGPSAPTVAAEEWGRDPFGNPFSTGADQPDNKGLRYEGQGKLLTGIIYGKTERIAIIGGEARREGDRVGDQKLMQIMRNSVVLMDQSGNREELFLESYSIRR
jgi:hypothetical protein